MIGEVDFSDYDNTVRTSNIHEGCMMTRPSREEVWLRAWCAVAMSPSNFAVGCAAAADEALRCFDEQFNPYSTR